MNRPLVTAAGALAPGAAGVLSAVAIPPLAAQSAATQTAAVETTTFAVENMTCALCPVTVKTAMERVGGVRSVAIDFNAKTATVAFDPSMTTVEANRGGLDERRLSGDAQELGPAA